MNSSTHAAETESADKIDAMKKSKDGAAASGEKKSAKKPVLLVDDDSKLGAMISKYLVDFDFVVDAKTRPSEGLKALSASRYEAAIFDVMMPEMDGFELCRRARDMHPNLPILMLTARGELTDRVAGLEIGADDYLPKPFNPRELAARLKALLRRAAQMPGDGALLSFEGIRINMGTRRVWLEDSQGEKEEVVLTAAEFRVLEELAKQRPAVVGRNELVEKFRGFERDVFDRTVDISVSRLRAKLRDSASKPRFIQTLRGAGYAFVARPK